MRSGRSWSRPLLSCIVRSCSFVRCRSGLGGGAGPTLRRRAIVGMHVPYGGRGRASMAVPDNPTSRRFGKRWLLRVSWEFLLWFRVKPHTSSCSLVADALRKAPLVLPRACRGRTRPHRVDVVAGDASVVPCASHVAEGSDRSWGQDATRGHERDVHRSMLLGSRRLVSRPAMLGAVKMPSRQCSLCALDRSFAWISSSLHPPLLLRLLGCCRCHSVS